MSDLQASPSKPPLAWIQLELVPLPHCQDQYQKMVVWWNLDEKTIAGDHAPLVIRLINEALEKGSSGPNESVEINDPLSTPTELAAILGKYFWVIPQPVEQPGVIVENQDDQPNSNNHSIQ